MLQAESVSVRFPGGVTALDRVDLAIDPGETVVLAGESGSGKTTLMRLFNALQSPTEGRVFFHGEPVSDRDPIALRRGIGYIQQEGGLLPHWTVVRNVGLVPRLLGWEAGRTRARVEDLLARVGLDPGRFAHRYPGELSGGQRQRVAIARALAADPEVVLLDEPFGALDALTRRELQVEFENLKSELGKTMLLVTHDLEEAFRLGDRIAVMKEGRILRCDRPDALRRDPGDGYVRRLLEMAPLAEMGS